MSRPRVNALGELDLASVDALSGADLGEWIRDRLQGRDLSVPSDPRNGQMPHYLLSLVYPKLSRQVREDFQFIVVDFVRDVVRRRDASWQGEPADELLMLLNSLLPSFSDKAVALELLLEIVEGADSPDHTHFDLRFRALQGVITLGHRTDAGFWLRQLQAGGDRYYPVFLEGLSLVGVSVLFESLARMKWTQQLSDAVVAILPNLLEEYGAGKVGTVIEENLSRFSPKARETLIEFLQDEELLPVSKSVSARESRVRSKPLESSYGWAKSALVVDPEPSPQTERTYLPLLHNLGLKASVVSNAEEALALVKQSSVDLVIADLTLPTINGLDLVRQIRDFDRDIPVIVVTAYTDVESGAKASQLGALDFLRKPFDAEELGNRIKRVLQVRDLQQDNELLREQLQGRLGFGEMTGVSEKMQALFRTIKKVSAFESPVLILGETGTGKELVARSIHASGPRRDRPFVRVDLAALPGELTESELFGFAAGAFTGSPGGKLGKMELAQGGTLFLDEIGEVSLETQAKLLRALQEKEIKPVGSTERRKIDVHIVAATNRDLAVDVRDGRFREDLYYRLNVLPISVPPLRERKADIPVLVAAFVDKFSQFKGVSTKIAEDAMTCLLTYDWPGNVRELQNVIERAVILSSKSVVTRADLPPNLQSSTSELAETKEILSLKELERRMITMVLERTRGDRSAAAKYLGIKNKELSEKMKSLGLESKRPLAE
jgi:two-component system NtrC family response regulator/two-component system response regulator HydG/two-component system response regulator AtoC